MSSFRATDRDAVFSSTHSLTHSFTHSHLSWFQRRWESLICSCCYCECRKLFTVHTVKSKKNQGLENASLRLKILVKWITFIMYYVLFWSDSLYQGNGVGLRPESFQLYFQEAFSYWLIAKVFNWNFPSKCHFVSKVYLSQFSYSLHFNATKVFLLWGWHHIETPSKYPGFEIFSQEFIWECDVL